MKKIIFILTSLTISIVCSITLAQNREVEDANKLTIMERIKRIEKFYDRKVEPSEETRKYKVFGTIGKELSVIEAGKETVLFSYKGKGSLTHMWFGGDWPDFGKTRIRIYVDDERQPSIDMEMALGHGIGFQDSSAPWGIARIGTTGYPSGVYNTYKIPFGRNIRITARPVNSLQGKQCFWWIIRGVTNLPVQIGDVTLPDNARLKLYKNENYTARPLEEFALCSVKSPGALYQVTIAAKSSNYNYLEACMRAYIDGSEEPLMLSSGLEDYFLGTYYFNRGKYYTPVAGLTHKDDGDCSFSAYRFHEDDPIFFEQGLKLTCRCGEKIGEKVFSNPQPTTYTTYTWVYQW